MAVKIITAPQHLAFASHKKQGLGSELITTMLFVRGDLWAIGCAALVFMAGA